MCRKIRVSKPGPPVRRLIEQGQRHTEERSMRFMMFMKPNIPEDEYMPAADDVRR